MECDCKNKESQDLVMLKSKSILDLFKDELNKYFPDRYFIEGRTSNNRFEVFISIEGMNYTITCNSRLITNIIICVNCKKYLGWDDQDLFNDVIEECEKIRNKFKIIELTREIKALKLKRQMKYITLTKD